MIDWLFPYDSYRAPPEPAWPKYEYRVEYAPPAKSDAPALLKRIRKLERQNRRLLRKIAAIRSRSQTQEG